jgi:hypothetical protein
MQKWQLVAVGAVVGGMVGGTVAFVGVLARRAATPVVARSEGPEAQDVPDTIAPVTVVERQTIIREPVSTKAPAPATESSGEVQRAAEPENVAAELESRFQSDRGPTESAKKCENVLRAALSDRQLQGVHLNQVECRAETCRVELTFDNLQADREILTRVLSPNAPIATLGKAITIPIRNTDADGKVSATMYLSPRQESPSQALGI